MTTAAGRLILGIDAGGVFPSFDRAISPGLTATVHVMVLTPWSRTCHFWGASGNRGALA